MSAGGGSHLFRRPLGSRNSYLSDTAAAEAAIEAETATTKPTITATSATTTPTTHSRRLTMASLTLVTIVVAAQTATCHQQQQQQRQQYLRQVAAEGQPQQLLLHQYQLTSSNQQSAMIAVAAAAAAASVAATTTSSGSNGSIDEGVTRADDQLPGAGVTTSVASSTLLSAVAGSLEDSMKFPLYMRIIATIACLLIFAVGVSGNLLVPLVVIKTKYLRNSTNLFLINLSVADLLVLIVCMPTVLIELHSRPETWLLGEPMCKLSNYVEMLAANGSIFTILAISFERYYAICKPLKAGYKCTRLRATIIICLIWLLASLLTSPILMMAKSNETIYIDGSLVNNCILESNTHWTKMYVFVSMIAFFCLPLLVLMLVYWLIGRRLTRESIAVSATTSLSASENGTTDVAHHNQRQQTKSPTDNAASFRRTGQRLRKAVSLKTLSAFLTSFQTQKHQQNNGVRLNNNGNFCNANANANNSTNRTSLDQLSGGSPLELRNNNKKLTSGNKSLSLDHRLLANNNSHTSREVASHRQVQADNHLELSSSHLFQAQKHLEPKTRELRKSLANQIVYQLFHLKSPKNETTAHVATNGHVISTSSSSKIAVNHTNGLPIDSTTNIINKSSGRNDICFSPTTPSEEETSTKQQQQQQQQTNSQSPFLPKEIAKSNGNACDGSVYSDMRFVVYAKGESRCNFKVPRLRWLRNLTGSSLSTSANTDSTNLPSESSIALSLSQNTTSNEQQLITTRNSVRSILHSDRSISPSSNSHEIRKKFAHFNVDSISQDPHDAATCHTNSSLTNDGSYSSSASPSSASKSPSPDSLSSSRQHTGQHLTHIDHRPATTFSSSPTMNRHHLLMQTKVHADSSPLVGNSPSDSEPDFHLPAKRRTYRGRASNHHHRCAQDEAAGDDDIDDAEQNLSRPLTSSTEGTAVDEHDSRLPVNQSNNSRCSTNKTSERNDSHLKPSGISRFGRFSTRQNLVCGQYHQHYHQAAPKPPTSEVLIVQDLSKKQQMDSRRQVVIMLAFVVTCFFLLFFPYRLFTIWLILSTDDQIQSLGMETYYNLTYFCRILIYLHSAINPIAYNLISAKFRQAFMSILFCRGASSRRHFVTEHRIIQSKIQSDSQARQSAVKYTAQHNHLQQNHHHHHHHHHQAR